MIEIPLLFLCKVGGVQPQKKPTIPWVSEKVWFFLIFFDFDFFWFFLIFFDFFWFLLIFFDFFWFFWFLKSKKIKKDQKKSKRIKKDQKKSKKIKKNQKKSKKIKQISKQKKSKKINHTLSFGKSLIFFGVAPPPALSKALYSASETAIKRF